ncbi:hypothetical protein CDAR_409121 [Caerostris darwini]|uniref:Uncharacterized protein n=1 Tax=Caerostris darwini TaxID=1538125 RepID=A0AAV4PAK0_9ARAC|nr:hypothetical protein CDAR_409121 [Caerostris darwini]
MGMPWKPKDCTGSFSREGTCQTEKCLSDCFGAYVKQDPLSYIIHTDATSEHILYRVDDRPDISTPEVFRTVNVSPRLFGEYYRTKNYTATIYKKCNP